MIASEPVTSLRRRIGLPLLLLFAVALGLRITAALWLEHRTLQRGAEHEFPDSELYWKLALSLASEGRLFDGKLSVQRTPGYPLFLAGSIRLFGPSLTAARHAQAAVGAASCVLLFWLVRRLIDDRAAWLAAGLAAVYPYAVLLSAVLLSEALFAFVLLVQLLLLGRMWDARGRVESCGLLTIWAALAGLAGAAATLVRPSWILATPLIAAVVTVVELIRRHARTWSNLGQRILPAFALLVGFALGMLPWWIRNWQVTGHFVATTLWVGASLYDGLNPSADGSSQMDFLERPREFGLDFAPFVMTEWDRDRYLRDKALEFARSHPTRVLGLAGIKLARFWNPLPNAAEAKGSALRYVSLVACGPVFLLALIGAWRLRRRSAVITFLAGPVLYFTVIHLVFVSSVRYREAAMLPLLGLAGAALARSEESPE